MNNKDFIASLEALAFERAIDIKDVLDRVERAMASACRNSDVPYKGDVKLEYDEAKQQIKFYNYYYVVAELPEDTKPLPGQILLEDAQKIRKNVKVGSKIKQKIDFKTFDRIAATKFKSNLQNELAQLQRQEVFDYFKDMIGEIITGVIVSSDEEGVTFEIGKGATSRIPRNFVIQNEDYLVGDEKILYVVDVKQAPRRRYPLVMTSVTDREIVRKLFESNIPEVGNGDIEVVAVSRVAGDRSKVGVRAVNPEIDPKGACVGPSGMRIKLINAKLNGEKIDIFLWKDDPKELIIEAMKPATVRDVVFPEPHIKRAIVIVEEDQFSLAIGLQGINVRLVAGVIGYGVDIKNPAQAREEGIEFV